MLKARQVEDGTETLTLADCLHFLVFFLYCSNLASNLGLYLVFSSIIQVSREIIVPTVLKSSVLSSLNSEIGPAGDIIRNKIVHLRNLQCGVQHLVPGLQTEEFHRIVAPFSIILLHC